MVVLVVCFLFFWTLPEEGVARQAVYYHSIEQYVKILRPIKAQIVFSHVFTLTALLLCSAVVYGVVM